MKKQVWINLVEAVKVRILTYYECYYLLIKLGCLQASTAISRKLLVIASKALCPKGAPAESMLPEALSRHKSHAHAEQRACLDPFGGPSTLPVPGSGLRTVREIS